MHNSIDKIARTIAKAGWDAVFCCSPDNATYCSGFMVPTHNRNRHRRVFTVITADADSMMIVASVEENITKANAYIKNVRAYNEFTDDPVAMLADFLRERQIQRLGTELDYLFAPDYLRLRQLMPKLVLEDCAPLLLELRSIKEEDEIASIRGCCDITTQVYRLLAAEARSTMTEMDLYGMCVGKMAALGVEYPRMALGSGVRAADINVKPSAKKLELGEMVRFDVLGAFQNFNLDVARTATVGPASAQQADIWKRLREVHCRSIERIKPGASTRDIYLKFNADMKSILQVEGGLNFLGHGLGLTSHEPPYFNLSSDAEIRENMVMCIEPTYLMPGTGGYHIEDCLVVRGRGAEILSDFAFGERLFEILA